MEDTSPLPKSLVKLEERLRKFPVTTKQLELFIKLKVGYNLTSLKTIKTPEDYYDQTYLKRCEILQVPKLNTFALCKTIVMKNKKFKESLATDPSYPLFIGVIVQYETKLSSSKLSDLMKKYQNENTKTGTKAAKKVFHYRVCSEEESREITKCDFNGVTPFEWNNEVPKKILNTPEGVDLGKIPMVLSDKILELEGGYFYLGAGEMVTKFGISTM
ncbi:unnamed protein product [Moneuplotes crassus]|uniref:Uncharacterized protein n=1 Tax=Euplotes crassus TaxID=5936 RepID=A0AAD2D508_EUPCR|nr:unnamed protein product [Moneuplotes crassus]